MTSGIRIERLGPVQVLRFDRPDKKNAITASRYDEMADVLETASLDPEVGVCVFLGAPGMFSAGNDIGDFIGMATSGLGLAGPVLRFLFALAKADRPLMAGVDGLAVGIGATLLLHCDYVLATPRSVLRAPFTALALVPENGASLLGPRLMGHPRAFEFLVMGRDLEASAALGSGIVNALVGPEKLEEAILNAARDLAARPREAVLASRRLLKGDPVEVLARIHREAEVFSERLRSPEAQEIFSAFMSKKT